MGVHHRNICESQPLRFFDRILLPIVGVCSARSCSIPQLSSNRAGSAGEPDSGIKQCGQQPTAPAGRSSDVLVLTYGSTKKILTDVCVRSGAELNIVQLPLPVESEDAVVSAVREALLAANGRTRAVVLDEITSNTAFCLPIVKLATMIRQSGAVVIVDAAHSMFALNCSLYDKQHSVVDEHGRLSTVALADVVDIWFTNSHKYPPRAMLLSYTHIHTHTYYSLSRSLSFFFSFFYCKHISILDGCVPSCGRPRVFR